MNEKEKMTQGLIYDPNDKELVDLRIKAMKLCRKINGSIEDDEQKNELMKELLPHVDPSCYFRGPIYVDYGFNIYIGANSYFNYSACILDVAEVKIGNNVYFGPNVNILTAAHPLIANERIPFFDKDKGYLTDLEYGKPITIEDNVWVGGNVTILGGVTIGRNSVIGAGSIVTKSLPSNSVCYGNPAKAIRKISDKDSVYNKKDLFQ
ncbi:MAG: sugar O-acetyltransferase [Bacilli bacterium]